MCVMRTASDLEIDFIYDQPFVLCIEQMKERQANFVLSCLNTFVCCPEGSSPSAPEVHISPHYLEVQEGGTCCV